MKVFKFGGASVKDAEGVKNVAGIISASLKESPLIVVSAMGKVTNALEEICKSYYQKNKDTTQLIEALKQKHFEIAASLVPESDPVFDDLENIFAELYWAVEEEQIKSYDYEYDQIVSAGEMLSTRIVAAYLNHVGIPVQWLDARDLIRTDETFREGNVDWEFSANKILAAWNDLQRSNPGACILTQGFIGGTSDNFTTTLGREGSDYSAAIFAHCLNADEVIIWKDVPGVLNADPKEFPEAVLLNEISYYDAIELAYFGATVIHPKTLKPLQNKNIPLRVKSFLHPDLPGTVIGKDDFKNTIPTFIFKKNQVLISISPRDFSFIIEENIRDIFEQLSERRIKVNLMQNSALKFSLCVNENNGKLKEFIDVLSQRYKVLYNADCELITIRNYTEELSKKLSNNRQVLVEQRSRNTLQMVTTNINS
jgi:aspartate kinase